MANPDSLPARQPEPLDQAAVERVIRRAAELDAFRAVSPVDGLPAAALIDAAAEAGISAEAVRHALALERLERSAPATDRRVDRLVGPAEVIVERTVAMAADELHRRIQEILATNHTLRRLEASPGMSTWEKRQDMAATLQLAAKRFVGDGKLGGVKKVVVAVEQLPADSEAPQPIRSVVRVAVHRHGERTGALVVSSALGAAGVGAATVGGILVAPAAGLLIVPGLAAAAAIGWTSKAKASRLENELRVLVDWAVSDEEISTTRRLIKRIRGPKRR